MELADYLSIPYVVVAHSEENSEGVWMRRVACPELPGCEASAPSIVDALYDLDRKRVGIIVGLLRRGLTPPVPRPPLRGDDAIPDLRARGILDDMPELRHPWAPEG